MNTPRWYKLKRTIKDFIEMMAEPYFVYRHLFVLEDWSDHLCFLELQREAQWVRQTAFAVMAGDNLCPKPDFHQLSSSISGTSTASSPRSCISGAGAGHSSSSCAHQTFCHRCSDFYAPCHCYSLTPSGPSTCVFGAGPTSGPSSVISRTTPPLAAATTPPRPEPTATSTASHPRPTSMSFPVMFSHRLQELLPSPGVLVAPETPRCLLASGPNTGDIHRASPMVPAFSAAEVRRTFSGGSASCPLDVLPMSLTFSAADAQRTFPVGSIFCAADAHCVSPPTLLIVFCLFWTLAPHPAPLRPPTLVVFLGHLGASLNLDLRLVLY
ncbi:mucin-5AC-like isoform X3 [Poeciliopsis prolifica]|uniref:mucin-5AC-like isoform X3 n=1 Tax=Poeciliopsis prolifica TaxID=188132 RepID=UPI002413F711|nr:mucin-5AC-like isoform X3 [Poeciliopsis prolifica]